MNGLHHILQYARKAIDQAWRKRAAAVPPESVFILDKLEERRLLSGVIAAWVRDASGYEGDTTAGTITFEVILSGPSTSAISVGWTTVANSGNAIAGTDYTAASGTVNIPIGSTFGTFNVSLVPNFLPQKNRTFNVKLTTITGTGAVITDGIAKGVIKDDDSPVVTVTAVVPNAYETTTTASGSSGAASPGVFRFARTGATDSALHVLYGIQGDAENIVDYARIGTSVNIPAGSAFVDVSIAPIPDAQREGNESVVVVLKRPATSDRLTKQYTLPAKKSATVVIHDSGTQDTISSGSFWAKAAVANVSKVSKKEYQFSVTYHSTIRRFFAKSVRTGNVQVSGPNTTKYNALGRLVSKSVSADGLTIKATYAVPAPSSFTGNGTYTVRLLANQVRDMGSVYMAAATLKTFVVQNLPPIVQDTVPPTAPANLQITTVDSISISLSWMASTDNVGVTGYQVWRVDSGHPDGVLLATTTGTSYKDGSGIVGSTDYTYHVVAYDAIGNHSPSSNTLTARSAPAAPGNLAGVPEVGTEKVILTWTETSTDMDGFRVYAVTTGGSNFSLIDTLAPDARSYTTTTPFAGKWDFKVTAFTNNASRGLVESIPSVVTVNTDTQKPTAPTNLHATSNQPTSIALAWTASTDNIGVTGYQVFRLELNNSTASSTRIANNLQVTNYIDNSVTPGTSYEYTVVAVDAANNSSDPAVLRLDRKAPSTPAGLQTTGSTATTISMSWTASTQGVDDTGDVTYDIYRYLATADPSTATVVDSVVGVTTYTDADAALEPGISYDYFVKAHDNSGNTSNASNTITALLA